MPKYKPNTFRPGVLELESRVVPAVSMIKLTSGILTVNCNQVATNVLVNQVGGRVNVQDLSTNRSWSYAAANVARVDVYGGAGNDSLTSIGPVNGKLVRLFGGQGNDTLTGGNGREKFEGGKGNDTIRGGGNNDVINGGEGNDTLYGDGGNDTINGGNGNDWINGGEGNDILIGGNGDDTLITIDNFTADTVDPGLGFDVLWVDKNGAFTDTITAIGSAEVVNEVAAFTNTGTDRTLDGDRIADPSLHNTDGMFPTVAYETFSNRPLFGPLGPTFEDIKQGALGDCWILAGLGSIADRNPNILRSSIVDFGDGTYGVHLGDNFYRVDNDLPVAVVGDQKLLYTSLGLNGSVWVSIVEKAYAHYRTGANSYSSIEGGYTNDLYEAFRLQGTGDFIFGDVISQAPNASTLGFVIKNLFDATKPDGSPLNAVTFGIGGGGDDSQVNEGSGGLLMESHQYIMLGYNADGFGNITSVNLRNPWGIDGGTPFGDPNDGLVTISIQSLFECTGVCTIVFAQV